MEYIRKEMIGTWEKSKKYGTRYWKWILEVESKVPEMKFVIKAHKPEMSIRNICPKNRTWTYGLSKAVDKIIKKALEKNMKIIGYTDRNIRDIEKWAEEMDGEAIGEDEEMITIDVKEMFNDIGIEKLTNMIRRNLDW